MSLVSVNSTTLINVQIFLIKTLLLMKKKAQFCTLFLTVFQPHFYNPSLNGISERELFKNSRNLLF
ncbi:hypothetical protein Palpr_0802 [Paludibacter propionicigenes WB4]|uniref:Uncharacterized protein n=1 Tax=Paludibacter propionicigenes (strain DSM 17365 / JCM 13257 / WB4) TaxID=694427 RepID=E4T2L2_PALPW|nr:hypothetical protein Palpr_0802 [Paludibacter propionicigenes WB4]